MSSGKVTAEFELPLSNIEDALFLVYVVVSKWPLLLFLEVLECAVSVTQYSVFCSNETPELKTLWFPLMKPEGSLSFLNREKRNTPELVSAGASPFQSATAMT